MSKPFAIRSCTWCGAMVPHTVGRGGGPVGHVRLRTIETVPAAPCSRKRESTAEARAANLAELIEMGPT